MYRRLIALALCASTVCGLLLFARTDVSAASGSVQVVTRTFTRQHDELVDGLCAGSALRFTGVAEHWIRQRYADLPEGMSPGAPGSGAFLVEAMHFVTTHEVVSSPETGRFFDLHGEVNLRRTDFVVDLVLDEYGRPSGTVENIDHTSFVLTATERREGVLFKWAGHDRARRTTVFTDGVRVADFDLFFLKGVLKDRSCAYLAMTAGPPPARSHSAAPVAPPEPG